jgi:hypothetical protein
MSRLAISLRWLMASDLTASFLSREQYHLHIYDVSLSAWEATRGVHQTRKPPPHRRSFHVEELFAPQIRMHQQKGRTTSMKTKTRYVIGDQALGMSWKHVSPPRPAYLFRFISLLTRNPPVSGPNAVLLVDVHVRCEGSLRTTYFYTVGSFSRWRYHLYASPTTSRQI